MSNKDAEATIHNLNYELEELQKRFDTTQMMLLKAHRKIDMLEQNLKGTEERCQRYKQAYNKIYRSMRADLQEAS